ncbi:type II toxin-antitoxin system PemK/MazF family toxin [Effusibacillus lacus]|uniref:type II toxin-antitoxin system PemK/MazF family toxin n=1 Tax=Effusibacillus lacus TaxID=1348429 RepID=UPI000BB897A8|nr:type II toxin-antitoxin system PemK/MazF family toxin [Effusibacillus lacus]TCS72507.1 mRNA interferase MazF [Effusibacillus lacus]
MVSSSLDRGDLVTIDFDPQAGHEQAGRRPALVLSPRAFNDLSGFALLCPITNTIKGWPYEVVLPDGLACSGAVLVDQVRSFDWRARRARVIGQAPKHIVEDALAKLHTLL